ncbi:uncharacterized protein N7473_003644 [Penicillium subrubescens]|uniref:uncharacterized protein n=1 Tax=Penicillium subrubescens TaxID=1316194 RepID=UPI00254570B6|nr:uncharacterized protein N7473_003644 [Penicillium subrubescens]KAJ5906728.1 hypothetical protein N7473_003644 [Penicillium subrubescens]
MTKSNSIDGTVKAIQGCRFISGIKLLRFGILFRESVFDDQVIPALLDSRKFIAASELRATQGWLKLVCPPMEICQVSLDMHTFKC